MTSEAPTFFRQLGQLVGGQPTQDLPKRVLTAIEVQENRGEVLVKLFQIFIVSIWAVLYAVSPKPTVEGGALAPYVLGIYLAASILGLAWAWRRRLPDWAVYGSIIFDMLLLYILIWSFHIQYNQPASFYLKAPTFLYVFIFIALRTLRFQPRFVLAAGAAAIVGWLLMIGFVVLSDPSDAMITRNYVAYLTGNFVLIGAEIDKLLSVFIVTLVLALSLARGRQLLIRATAETAAAQSLSRFFDTTIAERIRSGESEVAPGEGVAREAAIFNVDIRGFSRLVENVPPTDAIHMLSSYQHRIVPIIQRHGGTIDKFMGDGIMATFGAVHPSTTYAADALRAMDAILEEATTWSDDQQLSTLVQHGLGISVCAGPIVFGAVGDKDRLEVTVVGATVNLAAKLEKANKSFNSSATTTRPTFDLAVSQNYATARTPRFVTANVEGIDGMLDLVVWDRESSNQVS